MLLQACHLLGADPTPGLPNQRIDEQPAAHSDSTMDPPHRELDPRRFERLAPGENVLIDTVHQRPVEIEHEGRRGHRVIRSSAPR
jgi:hypothetical protein